MEFVQIGSHWVGLLAALISIGGCGDDRASLSPGDDETEPPPILVGGEQVLAPDLLPKELWFRPDAGGFLADGPTHAARFDGGWLWLDAHFENGDRCSQPFGFATDQVAIGRTVLSSVPTKTTVGPFGELVVARASFVERFHNNYFGVQQTWTFASRPVGRGDLTIRVAVSGQDYQGSSPAGLHFAPLGDTGTIYSHGLWIDAAGAEHDVQAVYENDRIVLRVPESVWSTAKYPAVLDPQVDRIETAVDTPVSNSPTGAHSTAPAVASNGNELFVVWRDDRNGVGSDIYGMRMSSTGAILSTNGIAIGRSAGVQANPAVAFVNGAYLVVWEDYKSPAADPDLRAARVSTTGVVTQLGTVAATTAAEKRPRIAVRGTQALVVYESDAGVAAARFDGTAFGAAFAVSAAGAEPSAAGNPAGDYLVTYTDRTATDLYGQLVTAAGALNGAAFPISAALGNQELSSAAFSAGNFIVVWQNNQQGRRIYGSRVSPAGVVLDTRLEASVTVGGVSVTAATAAIAQGTEPSLACNSFSCITVWQDRRAFSTQHHDIYAQRLDAATLAVLGSEITVSSVTLDQRAPRVALAGINYLVAWQDMRDTDPEGIYAARVAAGTGSVLDSLGIFVANGNNSQHNPAVARIVGANQNWLVAWSDSVSRGNDVRGSQITDNLAITPLTNPVSNAPGYQSNPAIAASAAEYLVAWTDERNGAQTDIYATRVSSAGAVTPVEGLAISNAASTQARPSIASDGASTYLVVWQDRRGTTFDIYGAIVNTSGQVVASDIAISTAAMDQVVPAAAYDPTNGVFVVVWQDARIGSGARDIYAARVSTAGAVLDADGVIVSAAPSVQLDPRIAYGSDRFLVVWEDRRSGGADIYGARVRVTATGITVDDPDGIAISVAPNPQQKATVEYVSSAAGVFGLAWVDERNRDTTGKDIYGTVVFESSGTVGGEFPIAFSADDERAPALGRGGPAQTNGTVRLLLTYQRQVAALSTARVVLRRIVYGASQSSCSTPTCQTECAANTSCDIDCAGATTCQNDCVNTSSTCIINCAETTSCRNDCLDGSSCNIDCRGSDDCRAFCRSSGGNNPRTQCDIDCSDPTTGNCDQIDCLGTAQCILRCAPFDLDCGFASCQGGLLSCGGGVYACGRPCP